MTLQTERLSVRPWAVEDCEAAFEIYKDAEVSEFIRDAPELSVASQREVLERIIPRYEALGHPYLFGAVSEKSTGLIVGSAMLKPLPGWPEIEIGWHLGRFAWGKGYAAEFGRGLLRYGFENLSVPKLVAVVDPRNARSLAVARRIGMTHEGRIPVYDMQAEYFTMTRRERID